MSKVCPNCGSVVSDETMFCTSCGTNLQNVAPVAPQPQYQQAPQGYAQPQYQQVPPQGYVQPQYQQPYQPVFAELISNWDGGVLETFVAMLVTGLLIMFTCGLGTPWAICYMWKYIISHTVIDGYRLTFDGNGGQLFGNWIKWFVLITITCGIYGFWVYPRLFQWVAKHTHIYR